MTEYEVKVWHLPDSECRRGIRAVWPEKDWLKAYVVMHTENGKETAGRIGARNKDGSTDRGCFQVNDKVWFHKLGWTNFNSIYNAKFNATVAYQIFSRSNYNTCPWYAVDGIYQTRIWYKNGASKCIPK